MSSITDPTKIPITESYDDVHLFVHQLVHKTVRKNSDCEYDEMLSCAHLGFLQAYYTYDPSRAEFITWVGEKVINRIRDYIRKVRTKKSLTQVEHDLDETPEPESRSFVLADFKYSLSEDASYLVDLVFNTPMDIKATLCQLGHETKTNWRYALCDFLKDLGWDARRITEAFHEVRRRL